MVEELTVPPLYTVDYEDLSEFNCAECGVNTLEIHEYYMLKDDIWELANVEEGMLCISCFESKTDMVLDKTCFGDGPINIIFPHSELLQKRIELQAI